MSAKTSRRALLDSVLGVWTACSFSNIARADAENLKNRSPFEIQFEMFKEALDLADEEKYAQAEAVYTDIIEEFETPSSRLFGRSARLLSRAYNMRGISKMKQERPEDAISDFSQASELEPDVTEFWFNKGVCFQMMGDFQLPNLLQARQFYSSALSSFENALILEPNDFRLYVQRADTLGFLGEHQLALTSYRRAASLAPADMEVKTKLALSEIQCGNIKVAGLLLERILNFDPDLPEASVAIAALYWQYGRLSESADLYQTAVSNDPRLMDDRFLLYELRWPPVARNMVQQMITPANANEVSRKLQTISVFSDQNDNVI